MLKLFLCACLWFSNGSVHNVYAEEEEEGISLSSAQLMLENSITMNKMKLLKAKMENMNLNKKVPEETFLLYTIHEPPLIF